MHGWLCGIPENKAALLQIVEQSRFLNDFNSLSNPKEFHYHRAVKPNG
jgi:hypothetical protein